MLNPKRARETGGGRGTLLVLVVFLLGIAAGIFAYRAFRPLHVETGLQVHGQDRGLSQSTKTLLRSLDLPVEIRFYSVLDPATVSDNLRAFSGRVDQLLSDFSREAPGKIRVIRHVTATDAAADAASADRIQAFNADKGNACFLGLTVVQGDQKESLPHLSPEWEQAIEFDLSRAIARVAAPRPASSLASTVRAESSAIEKVQRSLPNIDSLSVEEGRRILQEKALNDFKAAAKEMENQVKVAQQRLDQAQRGKSEVEQKAALKQLQDLQAEQTERLKTIAIELQNQIAALEQLKRTTAR